MDEIRRIYTEAFGESAEFDDLLFNMFGKYIKTFETGGKTVSFFFKIPCKIENEKVYYIYAAATDKEYRGKGCMSSLLKKEISESKAPLFLKPATKKLIKYYEKLGFYAANCYAGGEAFIEVTKEQEQLSSLCDNCPEEFVIMFSKKELSEKTYRFFDTME